MIDNEYNQIIFEDPEENGLDELLDKKADGEEETPVELPQARWSPSGAGFRAESADTEQVYCVDGHMVPASQITSATIDPDSMNFLLEKQKQTLEPDEAGAIPVGGGYRSPDFEELEQVLDDGLSCPFCFEKFTEQDCDHHDLGQLVYYGLDEKGQRKVYHWSCLALWMLILSKGHAEKAAEVYHVNIRDMRAIKSSCRAIPWGRLGWRRGGEQ